MAASFSLRDKWGLGAAAGVAVCLGLGGWAYNSMSGVQAANAPLRPQMAAAKTNGAAPASLDLAAGSAAKNVAATPLPAAETLVVHVTGCVKNPGVYKLHVGDRLNDAVHAAGGFKANAQQDALNLADTVRDADQICVPSRTSLAAPKPKAKAQESAADYSTETSASPPSHPLIVRGTPVRVALAASQSSDTDAADGESPAPPETAPASAPAPPDAPPAEGRVLGKPAPAPAEPNTLPAPAPVSSAKSAGKTRTTTSARKTSTAKSSAAKGGTKFKNPGDGTVHLNSAGAADLEKLPGVGPAMSGRILDYRREIGGFKSTEQVMDVKGIGEKKYAKMQSFLAL